MKGKGDCTVGCSVAILLERSDASDSGKGGVRRVGGREGGKSACLCQGHERRSLRRLLVSRVPNKGHLHSSFNKKTNQSIRSVESRPMPVSKTPTPEEPHAAQAMEVCLPFDHPLTLPMEKVHTLCIALGHGERRVVRREHQLQGQHRGATRWNVSPAERMSTATNMCT